MTVRQPSVNAGLRPPPSAADGVDRGPPNSRLHLIERRPGGSGQARQFSCQIFCHRRIYADSRRHRQMSLYSRGSDEGNTDCMYSMGYLYAEGLGVKPDYRLAQIWYQKSADHGKSVALYSIGLLYLGGTAGIPRDCATARQWFEKAAAKGVSSASDWLKAHPSCS